MEGDVEGVMSRPSLPSPDRPILHSQPSNQLLRTSSLESTANLPREEKELRGEIEKYGAWHECAGMSRTEAKRQYIAYLIETMKTYAVSTRESRELVNELDFVWEQVKQNTESLSRSGSGGSGESPLRGLRREVQEDKAERMRVLSPVGMGGKGRVVEGAEEEEEEEEYASASEEQPPPPSNFQTGQPREKPLDRRKMPSGEKQWRKTIESALQRMTAEIAALREQMEDSRVFPPSYESTVKRRRGRLMRLINWVRWLIWFVFKQLAVNAVLLALVVAWGRWWGDQRLEVVVRLIWGKWRDSGVEFLKERGIVRRIRRR